MNETPTKKSLLTLFDLPLHVHIRPPSRKPVCVFGPSAETGKTEQIFHRFLDFTVSAICFSSALPKSPFNWTEI